MALQASGEWAATDLDTVSQPPVHSTLRGVPEKRAYGSDFPFRNVGQRNEWAALGEVHTTLVSGAYGGFSNSWGAQIMPFTAETFREWPVSADEMYRHYRSILESIPYAAEEDDLEELFPLLAPSAALPPLSERATAVLARYERRRRSLNRRGILVGRARLALDASACTRCGLCMTGCPYGLIYSAAHTIDALRSRGRVTYHGGLLAVRVEECRDAATVIAKETATGNLHRFTADRVFLACGSLGTTQLVLGSLGLFEKPVRVQESAQIIVPFLSAKPTHSDPRETHDFTLNQFNVIVKLDPTARDVACLFFYTYNPAFLDALPPLLRSGWTDPVRKQLLRRLSVAFAYLPSWASPGFVVRASASNGNALPHITLEPRDSGFFRNSMLRRVIGRLSSSGPDLDLWPVLPMVRPAAAGKSYHWGGTFPHSARPDTTFSSDKLGRVQPWKRIHLVDGSVLTTVPATTFTLSVMANAHRIADAALRDSA